jgi:hypothetical protein
VSKARSVQVSAWSVAEGDCSPSGLSIVSVHRDPSAGKVRIGYSNGQELTLTGERTVVIAAPRPTAAILHNGADRARRLLSRAAR